MVAITGAAGGVGALLVERFLANGDTVLATDLSSDALERLRGGTGDDAKLITAAADISKEVDCERLADLARPSSSPRPTPASSRGRPSTSTAGSSCPEPVEKDRTISRKEQTMKVLMVGATGRYFRELADRPARLAEVVR